MGGFTVNGFGAADSYYPLKSVGQFYCKACRKEQEFSVMELKRKIKVLYIPTVSLYSKYAVACNKCKSGHYIEENVKDDILYGRSAVIGYDENGPIIQQIALENNYVSAVDAPSVQKSETELNYNNNVKTPEPAPVITSEPTPVISEQVHTEPAHPVNVSNEIVNKLSTESNDKSNFAKVKKSFEPTNISSTKKCPHCGFSYVGEPKVCVLCGEKL